MGRGRLLIFAFGYLALIVLFIATMLSAAISSGRPPLEWPTLGVMIMFASYLPSVIARTARLVWQRNVESLNDAHATVVLRRNEIEWICGLMPGIGIFVMGALPILGFPSGNVPIVLYYIIAAMGCYIFVGGLFRARAQITLSPEGLSWNQLDPSFVPWSGIIQIVPRQLMYFVSIVMFDVKDAQTYKLAGSRKTTRKNFGIFNWQFGLSADALVNGMEVRRKLCASQSSADIKETE